MPSLLPIVVWFLAAAPKLVPVQFEKLGITMAAPEGITASAHASGVLLETTGSDLVAVRIAVLADELPSVAEPRRERLRELVRRAVDAANAQPIGAWMCARAEAGDTVACAGPTKDQVTVMAHMSGARSALERLGGAALVVAIGSTIKGLKARPQVE